MENRAIVKIEIDDLGKFIGAVTAIIFALSVLFDWGYFEAFGLSFINVPTTISDHVRDALLWIPGMLTTLFVYTLFELMGRRVKQELAEGGPNNQLKDIKPMPRLGQTLYKLFVAIAIGIVGLHYFFGDAFARAMTIAAPFMMYEIIRWSFAHKRIADRTSPMLRRAIACIIVLSCFMYFQGYAKGIDQLSEAPVSSLLLSDSNESISVLILREMEKGILVKDSSDRTIFYRWDVVKSLSTPTISRTKRNRICNWFDIFCMRAK